MIAIYALLTVLIVVSAVVFAVRGMHQTLSYNYYVMSACVLGWLLVTSAYHFTANAWPAQYLDNLTFPFMAFLPVFLLRFVLYFYHSGACVSPKRMLLLCVVPAVTSVIALVPALGPLLRTGYTMLQFTPVHVARYHWGIWYYIHAVYSYCLVAACFVPVISQFKKQASEYKTASVILIAGMVLAFVCDMPSFNAPNGVIDSTLVGVCISMAVLNFAIINNPTVAFLSAARKAVYEHLDLPVFIMDKRERILDMNQAAHSMLETLGAKPADFRSMAFGSINNVIKEFGGMVKDGDSSDDLPHIFLTLNGENVVFKQFRRALTGRKGRLLGSYVAMVDITGLRRLVDDLQFKAEVDVLTGIPNRRAFERSTAELDRPENIPIVFVVGDVNRLKQVNDKRGHAQGDALLRSISSILMAACPERGFVARTGGDEFILVIPRCNECEAQQVVDAIHARLKQEEAQLMGASIALGFAIKTGDGLDVDELILEADRRMYAQKEYDRRCEVKPSC